MRFLPERFLLAYLVAILLIVYYGVKNFYCLLKNWDEIKRRSFIPLAKDFSFGNQRLLDFNFENKFSSAHLERNSDH